MNRYIVHWLERGAHTPSKITHADTLAACGEAVEAISLNFARTLSDDADDPEGFAARVRADALAAIQGTEPGRADDPYAPSVIIDFPIRLQRCGTVWATPCLVVVPVRSEAFA